MVRLTLIVIAAAVLAASGLAHAEFKDEDNSGFKVTVKSLPFFNEEGEEESPRYDDYDDASEKEYTYDATGRKVPVRTD